LCDYPHGPNRIRFVNFFSSIVHTLGDPPKKRLHKVLLRFTISPPTYSSKTANDPRSALLAQCTRPTALFYFRARSPPRLSGPARARAHSCSPRTRVPLCKRPHLCPQAPHAPADRILGRGPPNTLGACSQRSGPRTYLPACLIPAQMVAPQPSSIAVMSVQSVIDVASSSGDTSATLSFIGKQHAHRLPFARLISWTGDCTLLVINQVRCPSSCCTPRCSVSQT
jgi:hypothetical protein